MKVKFLSRVRLFVTPWTIAYQASPSMGFSRQEYWSGLTFPSPRDLPDPGIKPGSPGRWLISPFCRFSGGRCQAQGHDYYGIRSSPGLCSGLPPSHHVLHGHTHVLQRPRQSLIPLRALGLGSGRERALNPRPDRSCILWGERVATWHFPFDTDTGILIAAMIRQVVFQLWP